MIAVNSARATRIRKNSIGNPGIAEMVGRASTSIAGAGRGSWICATSPNKRLYVRPIDYDLVAIVDADDLDPRAALDFILRMGSLTF